MYRRGAVAVQHNNIRLSPTKGETSRRALIGMVALTLCLRYTDLDAKIASFCYCRGSVAPHGEPTYLVRDLTSCKAFYNRPDA